MRPVPSGGAASPPNAHRPWTSSDSSMLRSGHWGSARPSRVLIHFRTCRHDWPFGTLPRQSWLLGDPAWAAWSRRTAPSGWASDRRASLGLRNFRALRSHAMPTAHRALHHHHATSSGWVHRSTAPCRTCPVRWIKHSWVLHGSSGPSNPRHRFLTATASWRGPRQLPGSAAARACPAASSICTVRSMPRPTASAATTLRPAARCRHGQHTSGARLCEHATAPCSSSWLLNKHEPTCSLLPMPCGHRVIRGNWSCI